jgi:hypothetical protein
MDSPRDRRTVVTTSEVRVFGGRRGRGERGEGLEKGKYKDVLIYCESPPLYIVNRLHFLLEMQEQN